MPEIVTIGLVSISTLIPHDQLDAGTNILIRAGYRVKVAPNVAQCCMAPPAERARLLEEFWLDPEIDLLLFARGGEGAVDVVPLLDWERLRARPDMPVMGFSDITVLLNAMLAKGVGHPISGPMLSYATRLTPEARDWSHRVLRGEELPVIVLSPILPRPPCGVAGSPRRGAEGALPMGGHVTRLHWLFTNGLAPSASNRVVFLECTARHVAAPGIDDLTAMRDGGFFDGAAAVVLCDFRHKDEEHAALDAFFPEFAASLPCPVFAGFPYGHIPGILAIDFRRELSISPDGNLRFK